MAHSEGFIWATRGRNWGFRFLCDAGLIDPLPAYERAFKDLRDAPTAWCREGGEVALRFPDPLGRRDSARRVIPHEFVIFGDLATAVDSVEDGLDEVWPLVSEVYASIWESPNPSVG
ncbi:hypothetical protein CH305_11195 [Rhodococcus sp. 15-649-2-2]|nr:hypothetical protein CH305_11195 [Rhodococcus sp. 15-649-2-2]